MRLKSGVKMGLKMRLKSGKMMGPEENDVGIGCGEGL